MAICTTTMQQAIGRSLRTGVGEPTRPGHTWHMTIANNARTRNRACAPPERSAQGEGNDKRYHGAP